MDASESISQLLDSLQSKLNLATKGCVTYEQVTTWNSKLLDVQRTFQIIQNAFVPVNQLPIEILLHIFNMVLPEKNASGRTVDPVAKTLLNLTAVCQRWRHVAIANTCFWKKIHIIYSPLSSPTGMFAIASEFLVRSKTVPLSVKVTSHRNLVTNMIDSWMLELSREFHRLEEFDATVGKGHVTREALDFSAPNLKSLTIRSPYHDGETSVFPPIFKGQFPSLRKLDLTRITSWPTGLFTNLTSLGLSNGEMSGSRFLDVLEGNPTLTELMINAHGPKWENIFSGRLIHLPSLQLLLLEACSYEFILTHISFPQSCKVFLCDPMSSYYPSVPGRYSSAMNLLTWVPQEFIHKFTPKVIDSLSVKYTVDEFRIDARHLQLYLTISHFTSFYTDSPKHYAFHLALRTFYAITNCQPFNSTSKLSICSDASYGIGHRILFSGEVLDSWFSKLYRLELLELRRMRMNEIFIALLKENQQSDLPCATLRSVEVEIEMDEVSIEGLDLITDLVKGRYIKGLPLKYIKVRIDSPPKKDDYITTPAKTKRSVGSLSSPPLYPCWEARWKEYVEEVHLEISTKRN